MGVSTASPEVPSLVVFLIFFGLSERPSSAGSSLSSLSSSSLELLPSLPSLALSRSLLIDSVPEAASPSDDVGSVPSGAVESRERVEFSAGRPLFLLVAAAFFFAAAFAAFVARPRLGVVDVDVDDDDEEDFF